MRLLGELVDTGFDEGRTRWGGACEEKTLWSEAEDASEGKVGVGCVGEEG